MSSKLTRRHLLRGAGVALALPWLESIAPRPVRGQAQAPRLRFVPIYFPMGTASFWAPKGAGSGDAWQLAPILEPLLPVKKQVTVLSHVDNTAYGAAPVLPAYCRETGAFLTCVPAQGTPAQNGISIDEVIAAPLSGPVPPRRSLQLGLSTLDSGTEDLPPEFSRSISWRSATEPLFKIIDPRYVFDILVSSRMDLLGPMATDPAALERRATATSVLDFVLDDAASLKTRLGNGDRARLDQFMSSVRTLELRVQAAGPPAGCVPIPRPAGPITVGNVPPTYDRDAHANVMIDLMVLALSCDVTRVISLMLDDARSDFVYNFLEERSFTDAGSTPCTARVAGYRGLAGSTTLTNNGYATINWWFVSKVAALCQRLAAIPDGPGVSVLDNSVVWFGSGMHNAQDRSLFNLPLLYVGGGGGVLKTGAHLDFATSRRLSDVYVTIARKVFGARITSFADSQGLVTEILA